MAKKEEYTSKRVFTPVGRCAFMSVAKPKTQINGGEKYEVTMLWPKSMDLSNLRNTAKELAEKYFGLPLPANLRTPFKDGDIPNSEGAIYDGYAGHIALRATSTDVVGVVDRNNDIIPPMELARAFKSGDYASMTLTFFAYNTNGNKGISAFIGNMQKVRDGEPFGAKVSATTEFKAIPDSEGGGSDAKGVFGAPPETEANDDPFAS